LLLLLLVAPAFGVTRTTTPKRSKHVRSARLRRQRAIRLARLRAMMLSSPIHGTPESLLRQNQGVNRDELERIQDNDQLFALIESEQLIRLPENRELAVAGNLPEERRYCRTWTKQFVEDFATLHWEAFGKGIQVNSAVRTVEVQHKLIRHNGNAAAESGDRASPHLTGASVDISKRGMTKKEKQWVQQYLLDLQNRGLIDAEEEFRQPVFHITVYRAYIDPTLLGAQAEEAQQKQDQQ
jgi:hypothetical protein